MKHLDERISDLVDDRLDHDERDRALAHLTSCDHCRQQVELERYAKAALRSLPEVAPSDKLVASLLALAEPGGPLPPDRPSFPVSAAPVAGWRTRTDRPAGIPGTTRPERSSRVSRRPARVVRYAAAGALSAGAIAVLLASLGGPTSSIQPPPATVSVVPPVDQFTVEHARSTGNLPFAEPASLLVPASPPPLGGGR